ncbi:MAG: SpoIIE family protein phosphatase [Phycisphaerae bacterium]
MATLIITLPDGRSRKYVLTGGMQVMGRDPSCEILLDDPSASRRHAMMRLQDGNYVIEDLGSKNGTLVNDQAITVCELSHLDDILVGSVEVKYIDDATADRPSTVVVADGAQATEQAQYTSRSSSLRLSERRLQMLYELSERLMKLRDRDALLQDALDICFETLRFERGAVAVCKPSGRGVDWPVVRNLRGSGGELTISRTVLGRALDHGERVIVTDTANQGVDPTVSMVQHGIRSAMCVPLKHESEVLGVIYGDRTSTGTHYTSEDVDFFAALARQVTIGLINGRLMEEQKSKLALEQELAMAREIQERLFPEDLPENDLVQIAALNEPGRLVSGDYYDVIELADGRIGFLIADVTGKGVAASLLMSNLQAAVRMTLPGCNDLSEVFARWNKLIYVNTDAAKFVTCLVAILDPRARTLQYVTAGHPLPFLVYGDSDPQNPRIPIRGLRAPAGFPLGVVEDAQYVTHTVELGDRPCVVFAFTDGVDEAMDVDENLFGEERVREVLAAARDEPRGSELDPQALIRRMRKAITEHCRGALQSDDITMIAVRLA